MKNKSYLISLFTLVVAVMILLPLINAEQVNKDLIINVQCTNATYSNITSIIDRPNSTYIIKGEFPMTKAGTNFNYTLNSTLNNKITTLEVNYHCNVNGIDTSVGYLIPVTASGFEISLTQTIVMFFIISIFIIVSLLLFIFGIKNDYPAVKIFCLALSFILVVFSIGYILSISNLVLGEYTNLTNTLGLLYVLFIGLLSAGGFGILVYIVVFSLQSFSKYRGFKD